MHVIKHTVKEFLNFQIETTYLETLNEFIYKGLFELLDNMLFYLDAGIDGDSKFEIFIVNFFKKYYFINT